MMGWGEQADGITRGVRNAWAGMTGDDDEQRQIDLEGAQAREFRDQQYWRARRSQPLSR